MEKKNNIVFYIVIGVIIIILVNVIVISNLNKNSSNNNQESQKDDYTYEQLIMNKFSPYWRNTNYNCEYYNSQKSAGYNSYMGELSFILNMDNLEDTKLELDKNVDCTVQINNNPSSEISLWEEVTLKDNTYLGKGNVFENQIIKLCCGNAGCNTITFYKLC